MSKRDWGGVFALGLILVALLGWGIYSTGLKLGETKAKNTHYSSSYARHAANQIRRTCLTGEGGDIAECVTEVITTTNEHERAQDDLEAQTKMALWAFWMLVATVVMAAITALGVIFVWQTLKATQKMASETTRIGEAQVRAYLHAKIIALECDNFGSVEITIKVKNTGQSPAHAIGFEYGFAVLPKAFTGKLSNPVLVRTPTAARGLAANDELDPFPLVQDIGFDIESINNDRDVLWVFLQIKYQDVFGRKCNTPAMIGTISYSQFMAEQPKIRWRGIKEN